MNSDNLITYLIGYITTFLFAVFVTRAIFSIPKFLKFQRAQVQLLAEIALQSSVKIEVIKKIFDHNEISFRPQTNEEQREDIEKANQVKIQKVNDKIQTETLPEIHYNLIANKNVD